ncbi:hypothetical protein IT084_06650 [Desulfallas sp. Bu1-1]|uniref:stalk domain-containing protein n=1 Tax=Desulfallas sp. Bu1-1 TaxID=2787620 RepID=UPI0018A0A342|nr:stalk domain-containing protein [Desulfallas sp. Bu1-1]MBF7082655.1 hypothetical protein [Desulfallas sp. Bu1-1]
MKKGLMLVLLMVVMHLFTTPAIAGDKIPKIVMPNGVEVHESLVKMKESQVYVDLGCFNNFLDVSAYSDFGGLATWTPQGDNIPHRITSVAMLYQYKEGARTFTLVVNKLNGEVLTDPRLADNTLDVIVEGNNVYLPLRAISEFLGATIEYNPVNNTIRVKQL